MLLDAFRQGTRTVRRNARRSLISISAAALGVAFTLLMLGVADGAYEQLVRDATRLRSGHVTVQHPDYLESGRIEDALSRGTDLVAPLSRLSGVTQVKPLLFGECLVQSGVDATGAAVMGVEPEVERATSPVAASLVHGEFLRDDDGAQVLIGVDLAERLDLEVGSKLVLSANDVHGELIAQLAHVRGIFRTGETGMDGFTVWLPLNAARELFGLPSTAVTRLALVLEDQEMQQDVLREAQRVVASGGARAYPWQTVERALADYVRLDRGSGLVFAFILVGISTFTIFNTVLMSVLERRREIAVRFALGTPRTSVALQLLFECLTYGVIGCILGSGLAFAVLIPLSSSGIDLQALFGEANVEVASFAMSAVIFPELGLGTVLRICSVVTGLTALTSLPAFVFLSRLNIVEELRA